jgi:hypothetical protein
VQGDAEYFSRRAQEERAAASRAGHANARHAHEEMARRYSELAEAIESQHVLLGLDRIADAFS